jgi:magnesium-transporting ATPase (P-type)
MNRAVERPATEAPPWHALAVDEVLRATGSSAQGLTAVEARARLARVGANRLPTAAHRSVLTRLLLQFHNLLIYVLLVSAFLAVLLGEVTDAVVILAVVVLNALIGFVQEGRAERALEAIRGMIDPRARVLRDGRRLTIPADAIVPGDLVLIEAGDRVAADLRLVRVRNLRIDEAVLTGESVPVEKSVAPVAADAVLGDRASLAFSGTLVAAGQGMGVAVGTGVATELGRISRLLGEVESLQTPLIRQMDGLARRLTVIILGVAALAFTAGYFGRGYALAEAFMVVVGLVVAAIPEGLPAVMTITLAIGVQRMARRNAIIRRLPAVETLGSVSVICSDKTGTLTRNEMTVREIVTVTGDYAVSGSGYAPDGGFSRDGAALDVATEPVLMELVRAGLLCNDAELHRADGSWRVEGDPMEGALVSLAAKAGCQAADLRRQLPRIDEIPFDSANRFMATLHQRHDGGNFILIKGAPERLLEMCVAVRGRAGDAPLDREAWRRAAEDLAARGRRVLAFAAREAPVDEQALTFAGVERGAVLLGLVGFIDPPRAEAVAAVAECRGAGIRVVMITGDHAVTAGAVARELGLAGSPQVCSGVDIEAMDEAALRAAARTTVVFARATPEHKLRLVEALQAEGLTVAMTGDGVNDAPALKRADVGVAMGEKGTEAAKQAAEVVLADDNFASIVAAVREGRTVYDNLMKVIGWTLPTNGGETFTILVAIFFGLALPITPVQILWINMMTAVALGLTLAFEPAEPGGMRRPPRPADEPILRGELLWCIGYVSVLVVAGAFGVFYWAESRGLELPVARTMVVNTIVAMEIGYLFNVRCGNTNLFCRQSLAVTRAVAVGVATVISGQALLTYLPAMHSVFDTRPLGITELAVVIQVAVGLLVVVELEKAVRRRWRAGGALHRAP